jgi:hypothetical protein
LLALAAVLVLTSVGLAPVALAQYVGPPAPGGGSDGDPAPGSDPVPGGDYVGGPPGPGPGPGGDYVGGDYVGVLPAEARGSGGVGPESAGLAVPLGRRMPGPNQGALRDERGPVLRIGPDGEERSAPGSPVSTSDVVAFGVVATAALAVVAARRARIPR